MELSPEVITGAAGILLSLIFTYVPKLRTWYAALDTGIKSGIMIGALALVSGFIALSSCMEWWVWIKCDQGGVMKLIETFILALVANQATYVISPEPQDVEIAKISRS